MLGKTKRHFFWTIELSPTIEHFGKLSVLTSRRRHLFVIILNNNNKSISNNEELAEIFNKHFNKLVENLDIDKTLASNKASSGITNLVVNAIKKYEYHPIM